MEKRLKEIVIYILENNAELGPEHRAQLESIRDQLQLSGPALQAIEEALEQLLDLRDPQLVAIADDLAGEDIVLDSEAEAHLRRLLDQGLVDEEQLREIRARALRLPSEQANLEAVRFLAASVIFDENTPGPIAFEHEGARDAGYAH